MLWYQFLCFVWIPLFGLNCEKIILPDGRVFVIPSADNYGYILTEDFPLSLERLYILEENSNAAFLCPKGYSIVEMTQELVLNLSISKSEFDIPYKHHASLLDPSQSEKSSQIPPCQIIYDCLGYQACLFKFSSKFCQQDLTPSLRKVLLVFIVCHRDDTSVIVSDFSKQRNLVLHIFYEFDFKKESVSEDIKHFEWPEENIFDNNCTVFSSTQPGRYLGNCSEASVSAYLPNNVWFTLGSVRSESCIQELKEMFCAFQYNKLGLCIPSFYHNKGMFKGRIFSYRSLPEPAERFNTDMYKKFLKEHYVSLIPARLAFSIMVYKDVSAAAKLLHLLYEPTFFYVFHVSDDLLRKELQMKLFNMNLPVHNVYILPAEKSFKTAWSSYETVRSELEGFEELLRFGLWDFVINLDEENLPLRNVHDLAIALAPYRGLSFFAFFHPVYSKEMLPSEVPNKDVFHVCDGQVYKIRIHSGIPDQNELQIYTASRWGTFSREFIEYLVDESKRSSVINKYQFYLQSHPVPEESYIATILMNSHFRHTLYAAPIQTSKEYIDCSWHSSYFTSNSSHCFQESRYFSHKDTNQLYSLSHASFFARRFHLQSSNSITHVSIDLVSGAYYKFFEKILPTSILKVLAEDALSKYCVKEKLNKELWTFEKILNLQIVPSLIPRDTYCRSKIIADFKLIFDYNYWFDISIFDHVKGIYRKVRLMMEPRMYHRVCYPNGDLRMIFFSPWVLNNSMEYSLEWLNWNQTLPVPYGPAFSTAVSVLLLLAHTSENFNSSGKRESGRFTSGNKTKLTKLNLQLVSPDKKTRCIKNENILDNPEIIKKLPDEELHVKLHHLVIHCGEMEPGFWTLRITQEKDTRSKVYEYHFLLLDLQHDDILDLQLQDVKQLWKMKYFAFMTEDYVFNFDEDEDYQRIHFHSESPQKKIHDFSKVLASNAFSNILKENENKSTHWFICSGGVTTVITLSLDLFLLFYYWKHHFYKTLILLMMLSLTFASVLQMTISIMFCMR